MQPFMFIQYHRRPVVKAAMFFAVIAALILAGCGGGGTSATTQPPSQPGSSQPSTTQVQVNLGDSPADQLVAFSMTINSMSMTKSAGGTVQVVSAPMSIEMTHLMGTMQPLGMVAVPQGTYNSATMSIGSTVVSYMDPVSRTMKQKTMNGPFTATMNFNPAITVGTSPMALNMDMNMGMSVSIDGSGNVTFTPSVTCSTGAMGSGNGLDPEHGGMQHVVGSVSSTSTGSFSMSTMMGAQTLTFQVNSSTVFQGGLSGMGMMGSGMIVNVDAVMQSDGTMLAKTVRRMADSGGMMAGGLINAVTGSPATQLTLVAQNGMGSGMMQSVLANTVTVNVGTSTAYQLDQDDVSLSGLPFTPVFDASHIYAGQRVDVDSSGAFSPGSGMGGMGGGMMAGTVTANEVELAQQGFYGTVTNYSASGSTATFTLLIPLDSAFTTLTSATTITVYQQSDTYLIGTTAIANGNTLHVRGLLFYDGGVWKLVSGRIMMP